MGQCQFIDNSSPRGSVIRVRVRLSEPHVVGRLGSGPRVEASGGYLRGYFRSGWSPGGVVSREGYLIESAWTLKLAGTNHNGIHVSLDG